MLIGTAKNSALLVMTNISDYKHGNVIMPLLKNTGRSGDLFLCNILRFSTVWCRCHCFTKISEVQQARV